MSAVRTKLSEAVETSAPKLVITLPLTILVPPIVIASASRVPSKSPSTASIFPLNIVAVIVPLDGL